MKRNILVVLAAALAVAGCSDSDLAALPDGVLHGTDAADVPGDVPADDTVRDAATADTAAIDAPTVSDGSVVPDPFLPAKSFRFVPAGRDGDTFLVDVVARDLGAVFGIALRVEFDPAALDVTDVTLSPVFGDDGQAAWYKWGLVRPGSLALGLTSALYWAPTDLAGDARLARLKVVAKGTAPATLRFFAPRSMAVTTGLDRVEAIYLTATLHP